MSSDAANFRSARPPVTALISKYVNIYRLSLIERITYRGDFLIGTVLRFLPMVTTILLWQAIYAGADEATLAGFSVNDMIAYLLLVHVSRMFSSMPGLAGGISRDIRDGELKKYLLQPLDMTGWLVSYRLAHKTAYICTSGLPYAGLFFLCRGFFPGWPDAWTMAAYICSLLLGFLIGFFFECCVGMIGFWMLEVASLLYVINTINFFLSGHMFPLDLLPGEWGPVLKILPFNYLAYFPAAVFLGKVPQDELGTALLIELAWVLLFFLMSRALLRLGLRRYSSFGG